MKKRLALALAIACALVVAGCEPQQSLFGLPNNNDKEFDERLVGEWKIQSGAEFKPGEGSERIVFKKGSKENEYDVTLLNVDDQGVDILSTGQLVRLGTTLFIDFGSPEIERRKFSQFPFPLIESHIFGRVQIEKGKVRIDFLNDDWVKRQSVDGKLSLSRVAAPNGILVTASTDELRKFAREHADDADAFSESYSLRQ